MNYIGLNLPLARGATGYFDQTYDTISQVRANIINLLNTNTGERRMQPLFSNGLREMLFDKNLKDSPSIIKKELEKKITMFIPGVTVETLDLGIADSSQTGYVVNVYLKFKLNNQSVDISTQLTVK
jgi:phage baseplate assembly protein W